jgi:hypothetical protein
VYALSGWIKFSGTRRAADAQGFELRAPLLDMPPNGGTIVLHGTAAEITAFAEQGELRLAEDQAKGAPLAVALKTGHWYRRKANARGVVSTTPAPAFVAEMPRAFRDSLPLRAEKYRGLDVKLREAPQFVYADVEPWLNGEPTVRRQFVKRWRARAGDATFRAALIADLSSHPEWDPVLFPEKYLPKSTTLRFDPAAPVYFDP